MEISRQAATTSVTLEECVSYVDKLPAGEGFYENMGCSVWGEIEGADIMVLDDIFRFRGQKAFTIPAGNESATLLMTYMTVPHDGKEGMHDNDFYGTWIDPSNQLPGFEVVKKPDKVTWKLADKEFISRPPYWDIRGENHGVISNVTLGALGPVHRPYEPWSKFEETHMGGWWVPCWAEGTVTVGGKTHTLKNAYGMTCYILHGNDWDTFEMIRQSPYYWIWGVSQSLQLYVFNAEALADYNDGYVWHGDKEFKWSPEQISLTELETWHDPRSGMDWPCRWHINMNSEHGVLDMMVVGRGRGIFCSIARTGAEIQYGVFARGNGRFFQPDGSSIPIENMIFYVERGRTLMAFDKAR